MKKRTFIILISCGLLAFAPMGCQMPQSHFSLDYSNRKIIALLPAVNCSGKELYKRDFYAESWFFPDEVQISDSWKSVFNDLSDKGYTLMYSTDFSDGINISCDDIMEIRENRSLQLITPKKIDYLVVTSIESFKPEALGATREIRISLLLLDNKDGSLVWSGQQTVFSWRGIVGGPIEALLGEDQQALRGTFCTAFYKAIYESPLLKGKEI